VPRHPSDSTEQLKAEAELIRKLNQRFNWNLSNHTVAPDGRSPLQLDGYSSTDRVICEAYAHIGKIIGAQYQKVLTDTLKLAYAEKLLCGKWRKVLLFADNEAARIFRSGTWYADVIREYGVEIEIVPLDTESRQAVVEAQKRQAMTNVGGGG